MVMKKVLSVVLILTLVLGLASCAMPKSANALIREAEAKHGKCTVVSIEKADGGYTVVLHDELQDFDYTVRSFKDQFEADGAKFGSYADKRDSFEESLADKVISEVEDELDRICEETGTRYLKDRSKSIYLLPSVFANDEESGRKAIEAFAGVIQKHNLEGRMDNWTMIVFKDSDRLRSGETKLPYGKKMGSVTLPDLTYKPGK